MKKILLFLITSIVFYACKKHDDSNVYFGPDTQVFKGKAKTWFSTDISGKPNQIALSLDDDLMNSLPVGSKDIESSFVVKFNPKAVELTPFNHLELDWNPQGHPPAGVYDLPHFDIHFDMVDELSVTNAVDPAKLEAVPDAAYLPVTYINGPSIPQMGKHWIDITGSEFPPKPGNSSFTQAFIYGSYDSKITFYEPMISKAFLVSATYFERSIPQPAKFQKSGYYPTHMIIVKAFNKTDIILDKFVHRDAS
ncbi:MAG: hypothetical protein NVSMB45_15730 [Ginsengibacter sp.]